MLPPWYKLPPGDPIVLRQRAALGFHGMAQKILVVDDDKMLRDTIEFVLLTQGYEVMMAVHGMEALRILQRETPDVIILDLNMPVMDGVEFARQYRRSGAAAPIILCTADDPSVAGIKIGAAEVLRKPFGFSALLAAVERLAHGSAAADVGGAYEPQPARNGAGRRKIEERGHVSAAEPRVAVAAEHEDAPRPVNGTTVPCRGCRAMIPSHLAYFLRGYKGYRCRTCHDALIDRIARRQAARPPRNLLTR
ncbi:MAG TPA: response regulator [Chloroflexota bacterium]|nr:response regulator [Chloroflexota bacterium]